MAEELANGLPEDGRLLGQTGRAIEVDDQPERGVVRRLSRPVQDEFFRVRIKIPLPKRRGIDRVEQLFQFGDVHLDQLAVAREGIAGGIRGLVHRLHRASRASVRPLSTAKTPSTSRARTSAIWRSAALSTTPNSMVRPFFTTM